MLFRSLIRWRGEADMLRKMIADHPGTDMAAARARGATFAQCADELENRLIWAGLMPE